MGQNSFVRWSVLAVAVVYFVMPLAMTMLFSLWEGQTSYGLSSYVNLLYRKDLSAPLILSLQLSACTSALILLILTPAVIASHLYAPRMRMVIELIAILPFVVPAIAFVGGLSALIAGPTWLIGSPFYLTIPYFFLALPFAFRSLDVGLAALDLKTLKEAAESLGAGVWKTMTLVVLPNLRAALVSCMLMTFTVVTGEFTVSNIMLFRTFPVSINEVGKSAPTEAAALSMISFVLTWFAMFGLMFLTRNGSPRDKVRLGYGSSRSRKVQG
ncbi:ABC transporter permease subunit [Mesorhizobium sp. STM 4661]|uniref:ABC transporter permease n=1 Tax=Mesorhizobium sp. STM 4661 TaxID=1297570 RepID=UPI0002BFA118|nr:ABC transporter permease subunit [Mesorhizobium sp. STM 4661]CCV14045.1 ABC-type spermidine/putrescine transport system,permease component II [Mesorhizobium sp. STM 4661]